MKKTLFGALILLLLASMTLAATADKWLHIKVDETGGKAERVRVNIPLDLAEKIMPAINQQNFHAGKIHFKEAKLDQIDMKAVLEALKTTKDNEFVTVDSNHENVRVAKQGGYLVIKVNDKKNEKGEEKVDVRIPFSVIEALFSGPKNELALAGAVRALAAHGDTVLVSVTDGHSNVRIWVDSNPAAQ
jgi:hypothetical protein